MDAAVNIADEFLSEGKLIVYTEEKRGRATVIIQLTELLVQIWFGSFN